MSRKKNNREILPPFNPFDGNDSNPIHPSLSTWVNSAITNSDDHRRNSQQKIFHSVQEVFSGLIDTDVIYMVLSECNFEVDEAVSKLSELVPDGTAGSVEFTSARSSAFTLKKIAQGLHQTEATIMDMQETGATSLDAKCSVLPIVPVAKEVIENCSDQLNDCTNHESVFQLADNSLTNLDLPQVIQLQPSNTIEQSEPLTSYVSKPAASSRSQQPHSGPIIEPISQASNFHLSPYAGVFIPKLDDTNRVNCTIEDSFHLKDVQPGLSFNRWIHSNKFMTNNSMDTLDEFETASAKFSRIQTSLPLQNTVKGCWPAPRCVDSRINFNTQQTSSWSFAPRILLSNSQQSLPFSYRPLLASNSSATNQRPKFGSLGNGTGNFQPSNKVKNCAGQITSATETNASSRSLMSIDQAVQKVSQLLSTKVKVLVLLRGCPGSGKTTMARRILFSGVILSTDDYFYANGKFKYSVSKLGEAHDWNKRQAYEALQSGISPVIIDNTNTQFWEMLPYAQMAVQFGYHVELIEPNVEWRFKVNKLASRNIHGVNADKIAKMVDRYEHNITTEALIKSARSNLKPLQRHVKDEASDQTVQVQQAAEGDPKIRFDDHSLKSDVTRHEANVEVSTPVDSSRQKPRRARRNRKSRVGCLGNELKESTDCAENVWFDEHDVQTMQTSDNASMIEKENTNNGDKIESFDHLVKDETKRECDDTILRQNCDNRVDSGVLSSSDLNAVNRLLTSTNIPGLNICEEQELSNSTSTSDADIESNRANVGSVPAKGVGLLPTIDSAIEEKALTNRDINIREEKLVDEIDAHDFCDSMIEDVSEYSAKDDCSSNLVVHGICLKTEDRISHVDEQVERKFQESDYWKKFDSEEDSYRIHDVINDKPGLLNKWPEENEQPGGLEALVEVSLGEPRQVVRVDDPTVEIDAGHPKPKRDRITRNRTFSNRQNSEGDFVIVSDCSDSLVDFTASNLPERASTEKWQMPSFDTVGLPLDEDIQVDLAEPLMRLEASTSTDPKDWIVVDQLAKDFQDSVPGGFHSVLQATPRIIMCLDLTIPCHEGSTTSKIPLLLMLDKGTQADESEMVDAGEKMELLEKCFPTVDSKHLKELFTLCNDNVGLTADILIESGYEYDFPSNPVVESATESLETVEEMPRESQDIEKNSFPGFARERFFSRKGQQVAYLASSDSIKPKVAATERIFKPHFMEDPKQKGHSRKDLLEKKRKNSDVKSSGSLSPDQQTSLSFTLPPELAAQLVAMFGSLNAHSLPDPHLDEDFTIELDVETAGKIYQSWCLTLKEKSMKKEKCVEARDELHQDAGVDMNLVQNEFPHLPSTTSCNEITAPSSATVTVSQEDRYLSQSLSTKIKRQQLIEKYPSINKTILDEIYQASGYSFKTTIQTIESCPELVAPPQNVMTDAWADSLEMEHIKQAIQENLELYRLEQSAKQSDEYVGNDQAYEDIVANAFNNFECYKENLAKAQNALQNKRFQVASYYSEQARNYKEKTKEDQYLATEMIIQQRISDSSHCGSVDLHGLLVWEALRLLPRVLYRHEEDLKIKPDRRRSHLFVVTGRGSHSHGGKARLKPAVIEYLKHNSYVFTEATPGILKVRLRAGF